MSDDERRPQRRRNPLTGDFVVVSPGRLSRPWQGEQAPPSPAARAPVHDPQCPLCPGNARATGAVNPPYASTYAFTNDFAALQPAPSPSSSSPSPSSPSPSSSSSSPSSSSPSSSSSSSSSSELFTVEPATGTCRVLCFSPRHDLTFGDLAPAAVDDVVALWTAETTALFAQHRSVQVFENRGAMMGASMTHPHGQVWASDFVPSEVRNEERHQRAWRAAHARPLLIDVVDAEVRAGVRVVAQNDAWVAFVPFGAAWPFETLVVPHAPVGRLDEATPSARQALGRLLRRLVRAYDAVFAVPFPYSMGLHQRSNEASVDDGVVLHAHFYPPLLRSATVRKHMVGFEMLAEPQRDLTPEAAAERLRTCLPPDDDAP